MRRRRMLQATLGAGAMLAAGGVHALRYDGELEWRRRALVGFGTILSLQAGHADARVLERALDAAVARLQSIERELSLFRPDSAICRLNRDGRLDDPPADLREVLAIAQEISRASEGAFDVTVQPLWQAWAGGAAEGRLPDAGELRAARARVGWRDVVVDRQGVRFAHPGMGITLNGIAQGHAADMVRGVLLDHGVVDALVDAGEFAPAGLDAERRAWCLGIADPHDEARFVARLLADGRCMATSADNHTAFTPDHRHHHILDPRTGDSPPGLSAVTVAAARGAVADALTKVFFMAGPQAAEATARRHGVDAVWVDKEGRVGATPGLRLVA